MLAELLGRGEELFTFVACEDSVTLKNQKKYVCLFVCIHSVNIHSKKFNQQQCEFPES